jgi:pyruvyl transferase EpsO
MPDSSETDAVPSRPSTGDLTARLAAALAPLAAGQSRHLLVDFPAHANIGDSAIWTGEIALLARLHGCAPLLVSHPRYPMVQTRHRLRQGDIIYIHGGGNFGDIWPHHQAHREMLLDSFPQHRIVQLPQSLHFREVTGIERTKRAIGGHPDFHLMVRDRESADFARQHFDCPVILVPDAAFCTDLGGLLPEVTPEGGVALLRSDQERRPDARDGGALFRRPGWSAGDWVRPTPGERRLERIELGLHGLFPLMELRHRRFLEMTQRRVARGLAQLGRGRVVVTDRLHGHILASLLGRPTVVIDNFYGKIRRFISAWGAVSPVHIATGYAEALEVAEALMAEDVGQDGHSVR